MSQGEALIKNTLILGFGRLATQLSSFLLLPLYTVYLSPDEFGFVDLVVVYTVLLAPLLILQLDRASFRELIEARGNKNLSKRIISNTLQIVTPVVLIATLLYGIVASLIGIPHSILILSAILAISLSTLFLQFARGLGRNDVYAKASIILGATNLLLAICLVAGLHLNVLGALVALSTAHMLASLYIFVSVRLYEYISFSKKISNKKMRKKLMNFALPLIPSAVSWWFIRTFDRTLVTLMVGLAANGLYAAANKYALIFNSLYSIFEMSWTESAAEHININSDKRDVFFSSVYNKSFKFFTALAVLLVVITPFVFSAIVGDGFIEARLYIPFLVIGGLFGAFVSQYSAIYIAKRMTKKVLLTSISAAIISVLLNITLISAIGTLGAAISLAATFLIMAIWRHYDIKKYVNIKFEPFIFSKIVVLLILTTTLYYVNTDWSNVVNLCISGGYAIFFGREVFFSTFESIKHKLFARK